MKVITARIEERYFRDLEKIEKEEKTERAEIVRKLMAKAIRDWKIQKAVEMLKERKATIRKVAAFCGASYTEMLDLATKAGFDIGYTLEELQKDVKA